MAFQVIHDAAQDVAALIDPELGRALGPIATGEQAVDLLEKFAAAHGVDPATIPTPELESRWKDFVTSLTAPVAEVDGEGVTAGDVVAAGNQPHAGVEPEAAPVEPAAEQVPAQPADVMPVHPAAAEAPPVEPAAEQAPTEQVKPVTTPKPGFTICPTCSGWGEVVQGTSTVECPTCHGAGEVPVDEPATDTPAAA